MDNHKKKRIFLPFCFYLSGGGGRFQGVDQLGRVYAGPAGRSPTSERAVV